MFRFLGVLHLIQDSSQCQSPSNFESARFMVHALFIICHLVHGGVWIDKVVLGREQQSKLPNYGIGTPHAGVHEYWVSGCVSDRVTLEFMSAVGRAGISSCMTSKLIVFAWLDRQ